RPVGLDPARGRRGIDRQRGQQPGAVARRGPGRPRSAAGSAARSAAGRPGVAACAVTDAPGARLLDVVAVMDRLRSPGGCPWDAEQTHTSLMPYLLEEAYEAYDALADGDLAALREGLGGVLLQGSPPPPPGGAGGEEPWTIDDVACDLVDKLVRRPPHVFAGARVEGVDELHA